MIIFFYNRQLDDIFIAPRSQIVKPIVNALLIILIINENEKERERSLVTGPLIQFHKMQ